MVPLRTIYDIKIKDKREKTKDIYRLRLHLRWYGYPAPRPSSKDREA